jgi:hypothetical protein
MQHQTNQIQTIDVDPVQPYPHSSTIPNLTDSLSLLLIVFGLLNGIKKLWISIDKLKKQRKLDPTLLLQMLGSMVAILKALSQIATDRIDRDDEG